LNSSNLTIISVFLLLIVLNIQPVNAFDYPETSSNEISLPINLTILEIIGAITDKDNNAIGNFSHYLIGFEIYLENYSVEIKNTDSSTSTGTIVEEYSYDPFGQRIKIARNDTANTTIYTPFKELMRIKNSTGIYDFTYVYQDGILVARVNPDGSKFYYHPDHLGSTMLITDANGNVVENSYYSPYGELLGGGSADVRLYTGQMKDITNQYYYGARYYRPPQFIQPDTLTQNIYDPQALNHYAYVRNNPYKYVDPTGNEPVLAQIGSYEIMYNQIVSFENNLRENNPSLTASQTLSSLASFSGSSNSKFGGAEGFLYSSEGRYGYTTQEGFVDNLHFFTAATQTQKSGSFLAWLSGYWVEIRQALGEDPTSAFSYEDLLSNELGIEFASQLNDEEPLSVQYKNFMESKGASTDPLKTFGEKYLDLVGKIPQRDIGQEPSRKCYGVCSGGAIPASSGSRGFTSIWPLYSPKIFGKDGVKK